MKAILSDRVYRDISKSVASALEKPYSTGEEVFVTCRGSYTWYDVDFELRLVRVVGAVGCVTTLEFQPLWFECHTYLRGTCDEIINDFEWDKLKSLIKIL